MIYIIQYIKEGQGQGVLYKDKGHAHVVGYADAN